MNIPRVIPVLLLKNGGLVKTVKFGDPKYVGDPLNAVKIFNDKEVDELIFLDIMAGRENKRPNFEFLSEIASECFMPLCYGGGITTMEDVKAIIKAGVEKVSINSQALKSEQFVKEISDQFGSSAVVVSLDVKKNLFGKYHVYINGGKVNTGMNPLEAATKMAEAGAGEILLNTIDRDGTMQGYDLDLINKISKELDIPVIACGGAGKISDFAEATKSGASAAAAGSFFVFHGEKRAVLINYPSQTQLKKIFA